jgi:hypothetical protein
VRKESGIDAGAIEGVLKIFSGIFPAIKNIGRNIFRSHGNSGLHGKPHFARSAATARFVRLTADLACREQFLQRRV